jgi:hypothetical protein
MVSLGKVATFAIRRVFGETEISGKSKYFAKSEYTFGRKVLKKRLGFRKELLVIKPRTR